MSRVLLNNSKFSSLILIMIFIVDLNQSFKSLDLNHVHSASVYGAVYGVSNFKAPVEKEMIGVE